MVAMATGLTGCAAVAGVAGNINWYKVGSYAAFRLYKSWNKKADEKEAEKADEKESEKAVDVNADI